MEGLTLNISIQSDFAYFPFQVQVPLENKIGVLIFFLAKEEFTQSRVHVWPLLFSQVIFSCHG